MVQGVGGGWRRKWGSPEEDGVGGKVVHSSSKATHTGLTPRGPHKWMLHSIALSRGSKNIVGTAPGTAEKPLLWGLKLTFRYYDQTCTEYQKGTKNGIKIEHNSSPGEEDSHSLTQLTTKYLLSISSMFIQFCRMMVMMMPGSGDSPPHPLVV